MVSTVDQFGSQLMFRGYGVSGRMRPINAGLAGNDCLVILDEVHLSAPFAQTLGQVAELQSSGMPRRFSVVEMSATPSDEKAARFQLGFEDRESCPELRRRVGAAKSATLEPVMNARAIPGRVEKIVKSIAGLKSGDSVRSLGVVVNRVGTARETYDELKKAGYNAHLLTGRMRPLDRAEALDQILPAVSPDSENRPDKLTIVVATQAIEVGADFSFDAMISECAPVDSLRQRFGRLDRRGTLSERTGEAARAWIIGPKSVVGSKKPDPIYGEAVGATWTELEYRAVVGPIDIGPEALQDFPENTLAPRTCAPLLLDTHLDAWSQTDPEPIVQPPLDWFLHGIDQYQAAEVSILWRHDRSPDVLRLVPPRQAEMLKVPIGAAKSWLVGSNEVDVADVGPGSKDLARDLVGESEHWVRWAGFDKGPETDVGINDIRPGDILVVDPTFGGLRAGTWDPGSDKKVDDWGDFAQLAYRRKATLRLDPRVLSGVSNPPTPDEEADADAPVRERIKQWLEELSESDPGTPVGQFAEIVEKLGNDFGIDSVNQGNGNINASYFVLTERHAGTGGSKVDSGIIDGSDETGSMIGTGRTLERHLEGVGDRAKRFAERLGLEEFASDLYLAGRLHDIGKVDQRFQEGLVGGDPIRLAMMTEPLAKSLPDVRARRGGYPKGMRHEIASLAMVVSSPDALESARDRDLVLHLIGTHHGVGRPLPHIIADPDPQTLSFGFEGHALQASSDQVDTPLALEMADRFWRLQERYGHYGLAWLEAVFRLADHRQSEEEAH